MHPEPDEPQEPAGEATPVAPDCPIAPAAELGFSEEEIKKMLRNEDSSLLVLLGLC
jgi:hypothetical protein